MHKGSQVVKMDGERTVLGLTDGVSATVQVSTLLSPATLKENFEK